MLNLINFSSDDLLNIAGYSPANNVEQYKTNVPISSKIIGGNIRYFLQFKNLLGTISKKTFLFGPLSVLAGMQKEIIDFSFTAPITAHAKECTAKGENPDIYVVLNEKIEKDYSELLYDFSGEFISNGKFNKSKAKKISSTFHGNLFLINRMRTFARLELSYQSLGLTGLNAMKELLVTLIIAITEQPVKGDLPYVSKKREFNLDEYVAECRLRIEKLYEFNAFEIKTFSENFTKGKIGYLKYEIVEKSEIHIMKLRYYQSKNNNGKILYLASPLINKPEIFDLSKGKSVVEGLLNMGFDVYLQDPGEPSKKEAALGLDFYGKEVHDKYIDLIKERHKKAEIYVIGYCMGGTLVLPYLARRAEERLEQGKKMDIKKIILMASPFKFDDETKSGHKPMRKVISNDYDKILMNEMYGDVNVPPQIIEVGMNEIQPGVRYYVRCGFYGRAAYPGAIEDSAPFLYWLTHGTKFPAKAHREWINDIFVDNKIYKGSYCLPSKSKNFNNKPVNMEILEKAGVTIFDYKGTRDPISPSNTCIAGELWGLTTNNISRKSNGLNRVIEKNIGHIFVVSKTLLKDFLDDVESFLNL